MYDIVPPAFFFKSIAPRTFDPLPRIFTRVLMLLQNHTKNLQGLKINLWIKIEKTRKLERGPDWDQSLDQKVWPHDQTYQLQIVRLNICWSQFHPLTHNHNHAQSQKSHRLTLKSIVRSGQLMFDRVFKLFFPKVIFEVSTLKAILWLT